MSIVQSEKCINEGIVNYLPEISTLIDFCHLAEIPRLSLDQNWLKLFEFVTFNMSLRQNSLLEKIRELQFLLFLKDTKPEIAQYLRAFSSDIFRMVVCNYFDYFTKVISIGGFYNNKDNCLILIDLINIIPRFYASISHMQTSNSLPINKSIANFLKLLNDNSRKYERSQSNIYSFYLSFLRLDQSKQPFQKSNLNSMKTVNNSSFTVINNSIDTIKFEEVSSSNDSIKDLKEEFTSKYQSEINTKKNLNPQTTKRRKERIQSNIIKVLFKTICITLPYLIDITNGKYNNQLKHAKFLPTDFYQDQTYIVSRFGSFTYGLNRKESIVDFIVEPRDKKNKKVFSIKEITEWLNNKKLYNVKFTHCQGDSHVLDTKALLFNIEDCFQTYKSKVFLYNERYILVSQFFKTFFTKGNVFSKIYVFFNDILGLDNGMQLGLLIHGFYVCYYKLYNNPTKYYSYKCLVEKGGNEQSLKSKSYFYIESTSKEYNQAIGDNIDKLILEFLIFYYKLSLKKQQNDKKDLIKRKNYLFSINKVSKYLDKHKSEDYWSKIFKFYNMLIDKQFNHYHEMIKFFNNDQKYIKKE